MPLLFPSIRSSRPPTNAPTFMNLALKASFLGRPARFGFGHHKASLLTEFNRSRRVPSRIFARILSPRCPSLSVQGCDSSHLPSILSAEASSKNDAREVFAVDQNARCRIGFVVAAIACGLFVVRCQSVLAAEGVAGAGVGVLRSGRTIVGGLWPKLLQILQVFKEHGLVLAALLGLSAFFFHGRDLDHYTVAVEG